MIMFLRNQEEELWHPNIILIRITITLFIRIYLIIVFLPVNYMVVYVFMAILWNKLINTNSDILTKRIFFRIRYQ